MSVFRSRQEIKCQVWKNTVISSVLNKKIRCHSKRYVWSVPNTKKMVPFKKILSQIMNRLHTNHFCSIGTIMKFVINSFTPTGADMRPTF